MHSPIAPLQNAHRRAVLLVGHGTRDDEGTRQFFELGGRLAERLRPTPVRHSLLEFQRPTIPEAWSELVGQGATHVHVVPLLLFAAGHAKEDIPKTIVECQSKTPHVSFDQSRPLSRHPSIIELVVQRVSLTLGQCKADVRRTAVIMVGRGNRDPCAQADMRLLTEVVSRRVKAARLFTAFYAMAEPRLPDVIRHVACDDRFDSIVVHPHLLFAGRLFQAISNQVDEAAETYRGIEIKRSPYLGPDALVANAIAGRIAETS